MNLSWLYLISWKMLLKTISRSFANAVYSILYQRNIELSFWGMDKAFGIDKIDLQDGLM